MSEVPKPPSLGEVHADLEKNITRFPHGIRGVTAKMELESAYYAGWLACSRAWQERGES